MLILFSLIINSVFYYCINLLCCSAVTFAFVSGFNNKDSSNIEADIGSV